MLQLQSTNTSQSSGIKVLCYGPAGVGKTRLAATCPAPVIFSAESGLLSLRTFNLPFAEIKTMNDLVNAYNWAATSNEARQFATIFIDSASEIAEVVLKNEKAKTKDPRKAYGELIEQVISIVRDFRDLPGRNVVVIAKQETTKDEMSGTTMFGPSMPGQKLGPQLPYFFDEVFQYVVGTDPATRQRWEALRTRADFQNVAKDRSGALDEWERPDLGAIFEKIAKG